MSSPRALAVSVFWVCAAILLYSDVLYPLLMFLLAKLWRRPVVDRPSLTAWPTISVIIPAHNEECLMEAKLANALAIDYPLDKLEILVASDGSSDRTCEICRGFASRGVKLLAFDERRGKAATMNDAIHTCDGELVFLCDANVMFRSDSLQWMVARLQDPRIGAVSGDVRLASDQSDFAAGESLYYCFERPLQEGESIVGSMMGVDGGMYVIRRELIRPLPPDAILDDFVMSMNVIRQGKRISYEPAAIATENGTPTYRAEFVRRVRVAAGAFQSVKRGCWPPLWRPIELCQYFSHKLLRWLGPVWLFGLFVSSAVLWNSGLVYRAIFIGQFAVYLIAAAAAVSSWIRRRSLGAVCLYFVITHIAMGVGLIKGALNLQRAAWQRTERIG